MSKFKKCILRFKLRTFGSGKVMTSMLGNICITFTLVYLWFRTGIFPVYTMVSTSKTCTSFFVRFQKTLSSWIEYIKRYLTLQGFSEISFIPFYCQYIFLYGCYVALLWYAMFMTHFIAWNIPRNSFQTKFITDKLYMTYMLLSFLSNL